ncbi:MAG: iron ABC transporter permease, partial [Peptoniphilaceae bacterium]|nr:iron ABC transporter permease [Peptoniphilaceae bacterium]MDY3076492.1 iron ABC transporter permease [Peptoniphilaceae bacterium]
RFPRVVAALAVGAALSMAGLFLQAILSNALASPSVIGVNAGAGFFYLLSALLVPISFGFYTAAAFVGALVTSLLVFGLARSGSDSRHRLILAGVALSSMFSAGSDALMTLDDSLILDRQAFMLGGLTNVRAGEVYPLALVILVLVIIAQLFSRPLSVLLLGDDMAKSLGLSVGRVRFLALLLAAALSACSVSLAGILSFVGLLVPHAMRALFGQDYRLLIPSVALFGGAFLLVCDTLARLVFAPFELPVGILLSLLGAPFFIWLVIRRNRRRSV